MARGGFVRRIYIERQNRLIKVAIKENDTLRECFVEEETVNPKVGEIYKGIVKNIVPAMHCAFVDIGYDKNSYLQMDSKDGYTGLKKGDEVLVEIIKEEVGKKGPKVSRQISIPGAYLVVTNEHSRIQISKKIENAAFIEEVKNNLIEQEGLGIVIRTKAEEAGIEAVVDEANILISQYQEVMRKFTYAKNPGLIYSDNGILSRVLRNYICESVEIVVDSKEDYEFYLNYIKEKNIKGVSLTIYEEALSLFDFYGIERDILGLRHNRINLPSGGNIVIEDTEAMHVVDVNTAGNMKATASKESVLITNLEAAAEVVRQMKLRNFGGITVIDFIDMAEAKNRKKVYDVLKDGFKDDKNNARVYPFTELSLVQISRKKYGKSIMDYLMADCCDCKGTGKKLSLKYISTIIKGKVRRIIEEQGVKNIYIELSSAYMGELKADIVEFIKAIDGLNCNIYVEFIDNVENFKVEPILFHSQLETLKHLKIYPDNV